METDDQSGSIDATVGFHSLPNDLLHNIFLRLALPQIYTVRAVCKSFRSLTSYPIFLQNFNSKSNSRSWFFIFPKKWGQCAFLRGFSDEAGRWFNFSMCDLLAGVVHHRDDLYFLTACGSIFLFSNNTSKELLAVNFQTKSVKKIQPSPFGPLDTKSLRSSGMKLMMSQSGGLDHFRLLFVELVRHRPVTFEYDSFHAEWKLIEVNKNGHRLSYDLKIHEKPDKFIFLGVTDDRSDHTMLAIELDEDMPPVVALRRPAFTIQPPHTAEERQFFLQSIVDWGPILKRRQICGDGAMLIIRTVNSVEENRTTGKKFLLSVGLWFLSSNGDQWEMVSRIPHELMNREMMRKPYGVISGCIEKKDETVRAVLVSNLEDSWDMIWLSYDVVKGHWTWTQLPDCKMNGANMGGMSFSSGLTLT